MNRAEMIESLRKCAGCGHILSWHHKGGQCCASGTTFLAGDGGQRSDPCSCAAFVPGEQSSEGKRAEAGR